MKYSIKLFTFLSCFCSICLAAKAQQKHFIYVQSQDKQPFAVVLNGKVYSSSDYGYVIIPKLTDGEYNFTVSFPMNKFPDQAFTCSINKKDAGYMLKNGSDGWALQNMQTQKTIMNSNAAVAQKNAFGDMLSDVVSDSTLTKPTVIEKPIATGVAVAGTVAASQLTDTVASENSELKPDSISQPQKIAESTLDTGTNMTFVDKTTSGTDTINVFIPSTTQMSVAAEQSTPAQSDSGNLKEGIATTTVDQNNSVTNNSTPDVQNDNSTKPNTDKSDADNAKAGVAAIAVDQNSTLTNNSSSNVQTDNSVKTNADENVSSTPNQTSQGTSNPFYKPDSSNNTNTTVSNSTITNQSETASISSVVKQDCNNMLSDNDFDKLKRKMFVHNNNSEMIQYAVKFLNKKCITTEQVKALGELFSSDDGRYSLYDALYNYVYDYGNYPSLSNQILDPYYKKRFAAMLR